MTVQNEGELLLWDLAMVFGIFSWEGFGLRENGGVMGTQNGGYAWMTRCQDLYM